METRLPSETREKIAAAQRQHHLLQLLVNRPAPEPSNSPTFRAYKKAEESLLSFTAKANDNNIALITITTNTTKARKAQATFSRILEKQVKPNSVGYLAFFERTKTGLVHVHVIAALKFPVVEDPHSNGETRRLERELAAINHVPEMLNGRVSKPAKRLQREIKRAIAHSGLGLIAQVAVVDDIDQTFQYCSKYLKGVNAVGRLKEDKGVRLFSAGGSAKIAVPKARFRTRGERLYRAKLAAYAASHGAFSMADARRIIGPKWAYWCSQLAPDFKLRNYPTEEDFWIDWRGLWPPEALGITIDDRRYSPATRQFSYRSLHVEEPCRGLVTRLLKAALPLPPCAWPGDDR